MSNPYEPPRIGAEHDEEHASSQRHRWVDWYVKGHWLITFALMTTTGTIQANPAAMWDWRGNIHNVLLFVASLLMCSPILVLLIALRTIDRPRRLWWILAADIVASLVTAWTLLGKFT